MLRTKVRNLSRIAALPLFALGLAAGASAQQAPVNSTAAPATETSAAHAARANVSEFRAVRISRLIGMSVQGRKGEKVATVRDLIVNVNNGRVRYAVLQFDPSVFNAERLVPVPVSRLEMTPDRNAIIYTVKRDSLERAALNKDEWNDQWLLEPKRMAQLDRAWRLPRRPVAISARRGSTFINQKVEGSAGEPIGQIEDVVVHLNQQKVNYAIFRANPQWAGKEKRFAIPLTRFDIGDSASNDLVLEVDKGQIQAMQGLDYEQRRDLEEPAFLAEIKRQLAAFSTAGSSERDADDEDESGATAAPASAQGGS